MARTQHVLATMMGLRHSKEFVTSNLKEWESYASRLMLYLEINNVSSSAEKCRNPQPEETVAEFIVDCKDMAQE
ncbi:hypothetical protein T12_13403 [Trichinella patagoniensis]|uniref:Uncharacterized protein n=1 Tax=Trichinella patagoniensis TaxID=990121 RepID=A0A0V1AED9_9BILA|nr:hypothetical protein T12_13403 [Trichinella patagoniensis]